MRSLEKTAISGGFTRKLRIFCRWMELYRYEAHAEPAIQFPIGEGCRFCHGSDPSTIKSSKSFTLLELQSVRSTLTAFSGYGDRSTSRALTSCFTAMAPSWQSPQGFQACAWPAHPYDSFLAYVTGPRVLPYALMGKATRGGGGGGVCACVCVCVCVCVYTALH